MGPGNICIPCTPNCYKCNSLRCLVCYDGYYLSTSFTCNQVCAFPCASCNPNNASQCTSCLAGYMGNSLTDGCDIPVIDCPTFGGCPYCPLGYIFTFSSQGVGCT